MKACPGLRSGIDRSGSLSFAIRGIPSPIRPPIRHSGEGRNPEGVGRGKTTRRWKKPAQRTTIFILLCGLRKAMMIPANAGIQGRGGRRTRATLSRYGQFRHNLRSLFDHNLQNAQDKLRSNLNSSRNIALNTVQ